MKSRLFGLVATFVATVGTSEAQDVVASADAVAGALVLKRCMACHKVGPDAENSVGPTLNGIVGRAAGTVPGYSYSSATRNSGLVWDEPTLTVYLRAPRKLIPGTKMTFAGLKKNQEIADVIAYLKQFDTLGQQSRP